MLNRRQPRDSSVCSGVSSGGVSSATGAAGACESEAEGTAGRRVWSRRRSFTLGLLLLGSLGLGSLVTCGGNRSDGDQSLDDTDPTAVRLVSLTLKPNNDILLVDLNTEATKQFSVRGLFSDGSSADFTRKVKWSLDNSAVGGFVGPTFKSANLPQNKVDFTKIFAKFNYNGKDLATVANLTVVWLRTSGNSQDFFFNLPYKITPQTKPLTFSTEVQSLDVFFAVDTTGSMGGEINQLSRSLQSVVIPGVKAAAAKSARFGVGAVDDWPTGSYGSPNCGGGGDDQPLILLQPPTDDVMKAQAGVQQLLRGSSPRGCGADLPEGQMEALYQIATGDGQMGANANIPANHKGIGGVEFSDGALPVVVSISDASFHSKNDMPPRQCFGSNVDYGPDVAPFAHTRQETADAMNKICAKSVGVSALTGSGDDCIATKDLVYFAKETGAVVPPEAWDVPMRPASCAAGKCCTGLQGAGEDPDENGLCPLVFKITSDGTGVGEQVVAGIAQLARFASFDVVTDILGQTTGEKGEMLPMDKTTADFIKEIVPLDALPPPPPPFIPPPVLRADGKGFAKVVPGSFVRFNVTAQNELVKETLRPQVFHATIRVRAGGCANLDSRDVIILIPPTAPTPG